MANKTSSLPAPKTKGKTRIAIVGTGGMANAHAGEFKKIPGCEVVAGCDVDSGRLQKFNQTHAIPQGFTDYKEMLKWGEFDAVSVVVPDGLHAPISIDSLKAGFHVLCEKPLALNYPEAKKMVAAAKKSGLVNMVQLSYRSCSAIQGTARAIAKGVLGELRHVEAAYQQSWLSSKAWGDWKTMPAWLWRLSSAHGSKGVLGDVGVHILDFAMFPAGPLSSVFCQLKTFPKAPRNRIGEYVLDANDSAVLNVEFANGAIGTIHTSRWIGGHNNRLYLKISGTLGSIEVDTDRSSTSYRICAGKDLDKAIWREVEVRPEPSNFAKFVRGIRTGTFPEPDFQKGADLQRVLDACFVSSQTASPVKL